MDQERLSTVLNLDVSELPENLVDLQTSYLNLRFECR